MQKFYPLLRWMVTAATILLLCALAWQCLHIEQIGNSVSNLDGNGLYIQDVYRVEDVSRRLAGISPWAAAYLVLVCVAAVAKAGNAGEGEKQAPKKKAGLIPGKSGAESEKSAAVNVLRIVLYGAALFLILLGIGNGGMRDVLYKAINICTECIGLG